MMCRGKKAGNLVITASAAGGRCAADLACSQLVEQENKDALSGIPQLLCFAFQLERHISPGSKSFSMNSICKCLIDVSNVFCCLGRIHNTKSVWSTKIFFVWWPQVLDLPGIIEGESLLLPFCSLFCFLMLMSQARKCII